jgi:hypothetical protein
MTGFTAMVAGRRRGKDDREQNTLAPLPPSQLTRCHLYSKKISEITLHRSGGILYRSQDLRFFQPFWNNYLKNSWQDYGMPRPTLGGGRLEQGWCSEVPPQLSPGFLVRHRTTVYGTRDPGLADPRQPLYPRKGTLFLYIFGSGSCFSLWCGSGSCFSLWCGSGSYRSLWCGSGSYLSIWGAGPDPDPTTHSLRKIAVTLQIMWF